MPNGWRIKTAECKNGFHSLIITGLRVFVYLNQFRRVSRHQPHRTVARHCLDFDIICFLVVCPFIILAYSVLTLDLSITGQMKAGRSQYILVLFAQKETIIVNTSHSRLGLGSQRIDIKSLHQCCSAEHLSSKLHFQQIK